MASLSPKCANELRGERWEGRALGGDEGCLPNVLERTLVQHQLSFPCAPVAWTVVHTEPELAGFLVWAFASLLAADGHEGAIGMEYDEVAF